MTANQKLNGKIAVVTGGSAGIGFGAAKRFAEEGARVFITARRQAELDKAVTVLGSNVTGIQGDMSNLADIDRFYEKVKLHTDQIDILFVNAGFYEFGPLGEITEEHFDRTFNTNVRGLLFTVQKALPLLKRGASIILTGSIASGKGIPAMSVYSATKAAVRSFARSWILDLKGRGIRVNVLSPGHTVTPGLNRLLGTNEQAAVVSTIPMERMATPDDLGKAALFLASDDSAYVDGVELTVDGGATQY
jgi:NAD(P)-dependent dehydrogenase (short-subunit alcohol dehydrogenase family)